MYFFYIHSTTSTQKHSKTLSELHSKGVSFWTQSGTQIQGYGQRGRNWHSDTGNIFLTGCFTKPNKATLGKLSISIGVFLGKILQSFLIGEKINLKWPNDILIDYKKCGGILIEAEESLYIGIGINVANHPEHTHMPACHVHEYAEIDMGELVLKIIHTINPNTDEWIDFSKIQKQWWEFAKDSIPFWQLRETLAGEIIGIDDHGLLIIQSKNGEITKRHQSFTQ